MHLTIPSHALKDFTRAILCISKFGDDVDILIDQNFIKFSTVNSSRSAFCLFTFQKDFFSNFVLGDVKSLQINAKALLAPLRTKSVGSIEYVTMMLSDGGDDEDAGGEHRLIIRLYCQHGVVKTRKLTYTDASSLYARANKSQCPNSWIASSKILKDWMEHFHIRLGGAHTPGTDEIGFAFKPRTCVITSSTSGGNGASSDFYLNARPATTEITVDTEDFDKYVIVGEPSIMFALKEFKAIIVIAELLNSTIEAHFAKGGQPILIDLGSDFFKADFVIATSPFYDAVEGFKEEPEEEPEYRRGQTPVREGRKNPFKSQSNSGSGKKLPLFNPSSQQEQEEEEDFGDLEFNDDDFAKIDLAASQLPSTQQKLKTQILAPNSSFTEKNGKSSPMIMDEDENFYGGGFATHQEERSSSPSKGFGATQDDQDGPKKKVKRNEEWQLFP